jgi:hypothetical protein
MLAALSKVVDIKNMNPPSYVLTWCVLSFMFNNQQKERTSGKKSKRRGCQKTEEIGEFLSVNP